MLNNRGTEAKYNVSIVLDGATGIKGGDAGLSCFAETKLRFEVINVGGTSAIDVEGRLRNSPNWYIIATIPGAITGTLDISTYDYIRYRVTTASGNGLLVASGYIFNQGAGGVGGDATAANQVIGNSTLSSINTKTAGNLLGGVQFDDFQTTFPSPTIEVYSYYLSGVLQATVEITYTNTTKNVTLRARRI